MSEVGTTNRSKRLLAVSHPAVVDVNQLVYAELSTKGWHVDLVVPDRWQHGLSDHPVKVAPLPPLVRSLHPLPVKLPGHPQRHFYTVNTLAFIRAARPDVVYIEQEPFSVSAWQWAIAAHALKVPFGVQIAENQERALPLPVRALCAWVLRHAAFVTSRSPKAGKMAHSWGATGEVNLVPHVVPSWGDPKREDSDRFRVGFAGRLVPEKGIDVLVEAVRHLANPVDLVVFGDGPLRPWLEAQDLSGSRLHLIAGMAHADMHEAYSQMDVLVLPSRTTPRWSEQFGRVLVEALACGVPVVGSDSGEIPWVVETTGGGCIFPEGNAGRLAAELEEMRRNDETRAGYAVVGERRVRELFSLDAVASEFGATLQRAMLRRPVTGSPAGQEVRPRIALVAHGIHDRGGMERACAELIRHQHIDYRFVAVTAELAPDLQPLVDRWVRVGVPPRPIPLKCAVFFIRAGCAVRKLRPDLVHTVGALIPNRADVTSVHFCHAGARRALGSLTPPGAPLLRRVNTSLARFLALAAERWCYRDSRVRSLASVSEGVATEVAAYYPGIPGVVISNGIDALRFQPDRAMRDRMREVEGVLHDELVALFVGGDWDRKGLTVAIDALGRARSEGAPLWLWVVGAGDQRRFRRVAERAGVAKYVRFFGNCEDAERYYQGADMFVLPTLYETFSIASHEAAASGLPIVGTPVSGVAELIGDDESGIIVGHDCASVAEAMLRLVDDADGRRRLGLEAHRRARAYTWSGSAAATERLYRFLLPKSVYAEEHS